ncbi:hypothetical protein CHS0354_030061 [Potamilus streckersoni]|uniref:Mitochondrial inner membrane protease subunit n=1 Tax=Potamilus streckersoni TaxID=2493646 RepID=A0AAE0VDX2_9BIVA|nr:hypothetical protein CHS0354_030061 [Potamilus streckersoni]
MDRGSEFAFIVALCFVHVICPVSCAFRLDDPHYSAGDHLFANMHAYGFVVPFTDYKFGGDDVKKGDIWMSPISDLYGFLKRAVALEGDRVIIDGEDVYINGKREEGYDPFYDAGYPPNLKYIYIVIPEGKAFAMGDNRRNPNDSREWGYIMAYNFKKIEKKWQDYWLKHKTFKAEINPAKPKQYILDMFPYPSGSGLHRGHPEGYTATDIVSRYKRMNGFNVLHCMGWDAFGLPAEQVAIRTGTHPKETTDRNIANFKRQLTELGFLTTGIVKLTPQT